MPEHEPAQVVELDRAENVTARLTVTRPHRGNPAVVVAFHDPGRADPGIDDEVYALTLSPDRAWQLGTALRQFASQALTR